MKILVLLILQFALPAIVVDVDDDDMFVNHRYFTEKALDEQWGRLHERMIVMLPNRFIYF